MRKAICTALALVAALAVGVPVLAWGPTAHTLIAQNAFELLPPEIKPFYDANSRYMLAFVMLPDDWRDTHKDEIGARHYVNLDLLDSPPFAKLSEDRKALEASFGKEKLQSAGMLPWAVEEHYAKLVEALRAHDAEAMVLQSALLAHYVGDAHVPFHSTKDYDGKTPEQKGIHFRWEENLVALRLKPESVRPGKPESITDILRSAFGWCIDSYGYIDPILKADDKARASAAGYSYRYFRSLYEDTGSILTGQLSRAAEALAGVYISAWKEAGKPKLEGKVAPIMWDERK